jgi:hypothetical protein
MTVSKPGSLKGDCQKLVDDFKELVLSKSIALVESATLNMTVKMPLHRC